MNNQYSQGEGCVSKIHQETNKRIYDRNIPSQMLQPYIDVRLSLNSFLPDGLPKKISNKLVDFWIKKLTYNVTKHETVPKHEILTSEEINEVLQKYNITDVNKFNFIKQNDVVEKYYGMKIGDVCKIIRKSETAGVYINYRLCVL